MVLNDTLSNSLSDILNAQKAGHIELEVRPSSKVILKVLQILHDNKYLGELKAKTYRTGPSISVKLIGRINKCGSIKPRFSVSKDEYEKFESRYLPARDFGLLIVSTSKGIMTHRDAKKKNIGGKLLAYCY